MLHRLFTSWAAHLSRDGNYELAAKWLMIRFVRLITDSHYHTKTPKLSNPSYYTNV